MISKTLHKIMTHCISGVKQLTKPTDCDKSIKAMLTAIWNQCSTDNKLCVIEQYL